LATTANASRGVVSLERALSKLGLASRSEARALILAGRVTVDGRQALDPAARVTPERISVAIDDVRQVRSGASLTIALHKPRGYVTTRADPEGRKTVYDLLADLPERVVPVGRLDLATSGLLILTNDTQFANWLTDPANRIPRVYLVVVEGRVTPDTAARLERGIAVDLSRRSAAGAKGEGEILAAGAAEVRKASGKESHLVVTLTEGKNREIRRLFEAVGHPVTRLRRVQFGGLELGDLRLGTWRMLSATELRRAFPGFPPFDSPTSSSRRGLAPFDSPTSSSRRGLAQGRPSKRMPSPK
jgi:23S rRNA pseudouridine2605 synthase